MTTPTRRITLNPRSSTRNWREPLPDWVYRLNGLIRAAQDRLDELNDLMVENPSVSLASAVANQERTLAALNARHPDYDKGVDR